MNSATKNLEKDHDYILRLIDVMEVITSFNTLDLGDLESITDIIRNFADGFHHEKEEKLFFPLLGRKGFSPYQGPVSVMLQEHEQGRKYVAGIVEGTDNIKNNIAGGKEKCIKNMKAYIALLRGHILKENNVLFRMADNVLNEGEQQKLLNDFLKVEKSNVCGRIISNYKTTISDLERKYVIEIHSINN